MTSALGFDINQNAMKVDCESSTRDCVWLEKGNLCEKDFESETNIEKGSGRGGGLRM